MIFFSGSVILIGLRLSADNHNKLSSDKKNYVFNKKVWCNLLMCGDRIMKSHTACSSYNVSIRLSANTSI